MTQTRRNPDGTETDDLARRVRSGDSQAIETWLERDYPVVFRVSFGFLGNYAEAEDLAQESMVKLLDRIDRWNPRKSFRTWRNTVVANLCRDRLRQNKRGFVESLESAQQDLPKIIESPAARMEAQEIQSILMRTLTQLSPREREVFVLRDLEGISTAEVATTLSIAESSVRSVLTLARQRLKILLSKRLKIDGEPGL